MSSPIVGYFTLKQLLNFTYQNKYKTRFEYSKRDVNLAIKVIKQIELSPDGLNRPNVTMIFESKSWPQYPKYNSHVKGDGKQRKYHHEYQNILSVVADENGKFSMNSTNWKYRLGSQKKWKDKPSQKQVKTIYTETREKWKQNYEKEIEKIKKKYENKKDIKNKVARKKELERAKADYDKKKADHIKRAKYLDAGDFNSRELGINGDFYFRNAGILAYYGHLYGRDTYKNTTPDTSNPFMTKHMISFINALVKLKILTKE